MDSSMKNTLGGPLPLMSVWVALFIIIPIAFRFTNYGRLTASLISRFLGGSARLDADDDRTRLVKSGIAFVASSPNGLYIKVDELLAAVRAIVSALNPFYFKPSETLIQNLFEKLTVSTKALDTSKGKAWEYLIMSGLLDYDGMSVSDLVHNFYSDDQILSMTGQGTAFDDI